MMRGTLLDLQTWWPAIAAAVAGLLVGIIARRTVVRWAARLAARTAWKYDDALVESIRGPIVLWFVLLGLRLALRMLPLPARTEALLGQAILVIGILSITWAAASFSGRLMRQGITGHLPNVSLLASVSRVIVYLIGVLMVFQALGIEIGPIVATLGIGGLAVGLALQDTLANLFAGMRIIAARKIRSGDLIRLDTGQEAYVEDINWSLTTLREGLGNLVIVPNSKLASAIVVNYALPSPPQAVVVNLGVAYDSDLAQVERVTLEEALNTQHEVAEAVSEHTPSLRFTGFGESAITMFVVLQARNYQDRWAVVSDFVKRLQARYRREGIEIPYPHRVVLTRESPASPR